MQDAGPARHDRQAAPGPARSAPPEPSAARPRRAAPARRGRRTDMGQPAPAHASPAPRRKRAGARPAVHGRPRQTVRYLCLLVLGVDNLSAGFPSALPHRRRCASTAMRGSGAAFSPSCPYNTGGRPTVAGLFDTARNALAPCVRPTPSFGRRAITHSNRGAAARQGFLAAGGSRRLPADAPCLAAGASGQCSPRRGACHEPRGRHVASSSRERSAGRTPRPPPGPCRERWKGASRPGFGMRRVGAPRHVPGSCQISFSGQRAIKAVTSRPPAPGASRAQPPTFSRPGRQAPSRQDTSRSAFPSRAARRPLGCGRPTA